MRKLVAILMVLGICVPFAQVQAAKFTLRPTFGYGAGTGKMAVGSDTVDDENYHVTKDENLYYSSGGGIKLGLGLDGDLAEHLAFGLDIGYSIGSKEEIDKYYFPGNVNDAEETEVREFKASFLPMSLTLKAMNKFEKITVFAGFGPTVLMSPKAIETYNDTQGSNTFERETEYTFKMGLGYHGLAGIEYGMSERIVFIAQGRADQVSIKADKSEVTAATANGTSVLSGMTTREKNTTFVEDDSADDYNNTGAPELDSTFILPANSFTVGIGFGIRF